MKMALFVKDFVREVLISLDPLNNFRNIVTLNKEEILVQGEKFPLSSKVHIFGLGKASSFQVEAFMEVLNESSEVVDFGQVVSYTKDDHTVKNGLILELEGTHPVISEININNTKVFINRLEAISEEDTLIFLLSGGGSALLELPIEGLSFSDLQRKHEELLLSGVNINSMNAQRKKLSRVKGGGLLSFIKTKNILQFVTCDIPNEEISDISSGPIFKKNDIKNNPKTFMLNSASTLLNTLTENSDERIRGEVYDCRLENGMASILKNLPGAGQYVISGGEIPIVVPSNAGKGGRNTHFVLAFAVELYKNKENRDIKILSLGTDGGDGPTDAAGAFIDYETICKLNPSQYLKDCNSYEYFDKVGTLIKTGPTKTNVMDIRCIWRE